MLLFVFVIMVMLMTGCSGSSNDEAPFDLTLGIIRTREVVLLETNNASIDLDDPRARIILYINKDYENLPGMNPSPSSFYYGIDELTCCNNRLGLPSSQGWNDMVYYSGDIWQVHIEDINWEKMESYEECVFNPIYVEIKVNRDIYNFEGECYVDSTLDSTQWANARFKFKYTGKN